MTDATPLTILLVEDTESDAVLLQKHLALALSKTPYELKRVTTLAAAKQTAGDTRFNAILLDLSLPDSEGLGGLEVLAAYAQQTPIIILTGQADEDMALKAVEKGAQDYLFKDQLTAFMLKRVIQYAIHRKQVENMLATQALHDQLTGLANRILFDQRLTAALARNERISQGVGVIFLDLNKFKPVNDEMGHAAGDDLLRQVAERLLHTVRPYDTVARFGGDEFALLIEDVKSVADCTAAARKIVMAMDVPFTVMEKPVRVGASVGVSVCLPGEKADVAVLVQQADLAMYQAKKNPNSNYVVSAG